MKNPTTRQVALTGALFGLAIALSVFESLLVGALPLPPGVKLGLANIVVMYALLYLSRRQALLLVVLKAAFGLLTRGAVAGALSLAGGVASLAVMALLLRYTRASLTLVSVAGALLHNLGQFVIVLALFGPSAVAYLPVLIAAGVGMGLVTALTLRVVLPALQRTGLSPKDRDLPQEERPEED